MISVKNKTDNFVKLCIVVLVVLFIFKIMTDKHDLVIIRVIDLSWDNAIFKKRCICFNIGIRMSLLSKAYNNDQ